ncbi:50S ribosomal protein L15 [Candidatus Parcubacteria bacterium]|nr:50S ribosomal protein L15 [Candidatus Parcubacteria bacterium]
MQLHQLKPNKKKVKKRVGRGGAHGTTATRGTKGQKARSGSGKGKTFEGTKTPLWRRTPKLRGFKSMYAKNNVVNVSTLEKNFKDGDIVNPRDLMDKNLITKIKPKVKILGNGEISIKLTIDGCIISKKAEDKIKDAGGQIRTTLNS